MARKSVTVKLTPRQAISAEVALRDMAIAREGDYASRLFSAASAVSSALYEDGWDLGEDDVWRKEVEG